MPARLRRYPQAVRFIFLIVAAFHATLAVLQWRRNEAGELGTAVSNLDRRLKQSTPLLLAGLAAVAVVLFISG